MMNLVSWWHWCLPNTDVSMALMSSLHWWWHWHWSPGSAEVWSTESSATPVTDSVLPWSGLSQTSRRCGPARVFRIEHIGRALGCYTGPMGTSNKLFLTIHCNKTEQIIKYLSHNNTSIHSWPIFHISSLIAGRELFPNLKTRVLSLCVVAVWARTWLGQGPWHRHGWIFPQITEQRKNANTPDPKNICS